MASIIKSDNGVSSGITGIVQSADSSGQLVLQTTTSSGTATTAVTIDNSQNVGLGVTPSAWTLLKPIEIGALGTYISGRPGSNQLDLGVNNYYSSGYKYAVAGQRATQYEQFNGTHSWYYAGVSTNAGDPVTFTQAMTLDNSGNLLVGKTSIGVGNIGVEARANGYVSSTQSASTNASDTFEVYSTGVSAYRFYVTMDGVIHATSTSISAISDQTLKTNIRDLDTGLSEIMALQPRRFDWLNGDGTNVAGFISQEVQTVLPDLVNSAKYSVDENDEAVNKLFLKMGDMIPTMVKAIQELSAQVTSLKATVETQATTIATLQNKIGA